MSNKDFTYYKDGDGIFEGAADMTLLSGKRYGVDIFEAAPESAAVADFGAQQIRAAAMGAVLGFLDVGEFTFEAINNAAFVLADMDGDEEITGDEEDYISELYQEIANAMVAMGANPEDVVAFLDDEDDAAGAKVGAALAAKVEATSKDDETIITDYAVAGDMVMEAMAKVVRGGKVVLKRKKGTYRPKKMTSAQRAGLKKARTKAFTGAAKIARKKSMRIRKGRGL